MFSHSYLLPPAQQVLLGDKIVGLNGERPESWQLLRNLKNVSDGQTVQWITLIYGVGVRPHLG